MRKILFYSIIFVSIFSFDILQAQVITRLQGNWTYYFKPFSYQDIILSKNNLIINGNRKLLIYDLESNEVKQIDATNDLKDFALDKIYLNPKNNRLYIFYANSIIDIMDVNNFEVKSSNFDINLKIQQESKKINHVFLFQNNLILSTDFGVLIYNYEQNIIEDTYVVGKNGLKLKINAAYRNQDFYFLASDSGICSAKANEGLNLQDFRNWQKTLTNFSFLHIDAYENDVYAFTDSLIFQFQNNQWNQIYRFENATLRKVSNINGKIYGILDSLDTSGNFKKNVIIEWNGNDLEVSYNPENRINEFVQFENGIITSGSTIDLYKDTKRNVLLVENNPVDIVYRIAINGSEAYVNSGIVSGTISFDRIFYGHFVYKDFYWSESSVNRDSCPNCFAQTAYIQTSFGKYRSFGLSEDGPILEEKNGQFLVYDSTNSPLRTLSNQPKIYSVPDMKLDNKGRLFVLNNLSPNPLTSFDDQGKWRIHDFSKVSGTNEVKNIFIDKANNKWITTRRNGLIRFNEMDIDNPNDDIIQLFTTILSEPCELNLGYVNSMVQDKDDLLWVGSETGLGRIFGCNVDPTKDCIFDVPKVRIKNPNDPNDLTTECIFINTPIRAIDVDAGNNKWVASEGSVFYLSEGTQDEFLKFDASNSPLKVKNIYDVKFFPYTSEVLFTTDAGVLSFTSQSRGEGKNPNKSNIYVTPNPVPSDFTGSISIDGLPDEAYVKIIDNSGKLFSQGRANGTRFVWDLRDLQGQKVNTGVYIVLAAQRLGANPMVGSFTVIRD
ncbi:MAG: hypothetical protein MUE53_04785 [Chitinophagales bacterium]|jgi:hypothetical protein|nr:hypothetical protein [Chitinophagales bacterium]